MNVNGTYLEEIIAWHRARALGDVRSREQVRTLADRTDPQASFSDSILKDQGVSLIAECKRRSPSKGDLAPIADPVILGVAYAKGGASAISVLTDRKYFGGSLDDLKHISAAVEVPCLRKDFTVDPIDIYDARIAGASAILLIVAALDSYELRDFLSITTEMGLDAIVEVHSLDEISLALSAEARIIGINQRNLQDFSIDLDLACSLKNEIPTGVISVAESGISDIAQVEKLANAGFDAMLVGESLVRSSDSAAQAGKFVHAGRRGKSSCL